MPLTPEDVSNKRFTPVRLREGYDMGEVDQFLDEVEGELTRLITEKNELQSKVSAGQRGGAAKPAAQDQAAEPEKPVETIKVATVAEASTAAARLLEIAARNADELVDGAKQEADALLTEARTKAEQLDAESTEKLERIEADAKTRAEMLDSETAERRQQLFGDLEKQQQKLSGEVENLRSFEREYRSRLKGYFNQQLAALDGTGEPGDLDGSDDAPQGLRSLLGEDADQKG